jgi:coenzyme F420-reducing hydrogenase beta subunit
MIREEVACYGCGLCAVVCKASAITMDLSNDGFWQPVVDSEKCIKCNGCEKVCSYLFQGTFIQEDALTPTGYSVITKDESTLSQVTSGGAAFEISRFFLRNQYKILGVEYDYIKNIASHIVVSSEQDLLKIVGSKYLQSYTVNAFRSIEKGNKYAIFGCPCQIDSLRRFAGMHLPGQDLIFVDFFCHGVPSYHLWMRYLKFNLKKNERIISVKFRDKCNGWDQFTMSMVMDSRKKYTKSLRENDYFLNIFLGNYALNKPCYNCKFHRLHSSADIRLGDLWASKYKNNKTGVSGMIVLTKKGNEMIKELRQACVINNEDTVIVLDGQITGPVKMPLMRAVILQLLKLNIFLPLIYLIFINKQWMKNILPPRIKETLKSYIKKVA